MTRYKPVEPGFVKIILDYKKARPISLPKDYFAAFVRNNRVLAQLNNPSLKQNLSETVLLTKFITFAELAEQRSGGPGKKQEKDSKDNSESPSKKYKKSGKNSDNKGSRGKPKNKALKEDRRGSGSGLSGSLGRGSRSGETNKCFDCSSTNYYRGNFKYPKYTARSFRQAKAAYKKVVKSGNDNPKP
ncbi:hypothetical protein DL98DRAFT_541085 [Cadophora sp. DSE1049]|nr:hypothetical protein DL98DRAFT_541085 [Cadophora sp. DSE1049]